MTDEESAQKGLDRRGLGGTSKSASTRHTHGLPQRRCPSFFLLSHNQVGAIGAKERDVVIGWADYQKSPRKERRLDWARAGRQRVPRKIQSFMEIVKT